MPTQQRWQRAGVNCCDHLNEATGLGDQQLCMLFVIRYSGREIRPQVLNLRGEPPQAVLGRFAGKVNKLTSNTFKTLVTKFYTLQKLAYSR